MDQTSQPPQWLTDLVNQQNQQLSALAEQQANQIAILSGRLEASQLQVKGLADRQTLYEAARRPLPDVDLLTPSTTPRPRESDSRPTKPTLSDPKRYDHSDKTLYPQFAGLLQAKVKHDGHAIGSEEKQAWYVFGRLEGLAAKRIFPWIDAADKKGSLCLKDLFQQMDTAFLDHRAKEKALTALNRTKQGNTPLNDFLGQFDQLLLEAGGWDWDDAIKKGYLRDAISTRLLTALVGTEEKDSYEGFCNQLRRVTDQLEVVREKSTGRNFSAPGKEASKERTPFRPAPESDTMDWEAVVAAAVRVAVATRGNDSQKLTDPQLSRYRRQGLCFQCGKDGHIARDCPTKGKKKPQNAGNRDKTRVAVAKSKKAKVALPQGELSSGDDELSSSQGDDSGKE
jgi:hypothetical protein